MPSNISNYHSARLDLLKGDARNETIDNELNKKTNFVANRILAERPRIELLSKQKLRSEEIKEDCSPDAYGDYIDVYLDAPPEPDYFDGSCVPGDDYGLSNSP